MSDASSTPSAPARGPRGTSPNGLVSKLLETGNGVRVLTRSTGRAERYEWSDRVQAYAAAAIAHTGGQVIVRFQRTWPWVTDIVAAFGRMRVALPS